MRYATFEEARTAWLEDRAELGHQGINLDESIQAFLPDEFRRDSDYATMALDAAGVLTTTANSAVPAMLTTLIDPDIIEILFAPNNAAKVIGERRKGNWLDDTAMFPVVEHTGEVSSYGDFSENGHAGANTNWPQRQAYLFQTIKEYGERELARAGLARINWISELDVAAATVMDKFQNLSYFFGIRGLENYGLLNDPNLGPSLTPAPKVNGGVQW